VVGIAVAVLVIAVALGYFIRQGRLSAERTASAQLNQVKMEMSRGNLESAVAMADQLLDRFSGTRSGREAMLVRGDAALVQGKNEEAIRHYERFLKEETKDSLLRASAMRGLAGALEQSGQTGRAADLYLEAGRENAVGDDAAYDLMAAARAYRTAGDASKALPILEEIVAKHPKFSGLQEVKVLQAELGGTPAAAR
jgi:tetratricopeptide (TPR) repeat protein